MLRRLDCVLEPTKAKVLEQAAKLPASLDNPEPILCATAGQAVANRTFGRSYDGGGPGGIVDASRNVITFWYS